MNKKGITLITSIMLIVFASIAVVGTTVFIVQRLSLNEINLLRAKTLYLAQAGINGAVFSYRFRDLSGNGYFPLGQYNIDANNYFVLGADAADLLMVDTSNSQVGGGADCDAQRQACEDACDAFWSACYGQCDATYDACVAGCPPGRLGRRCRMDCQRDRDRNCYPACDDNRDLCYGVCADDYQTCLAGSGSDRELTQVYIHNLTNSQTITIDRMIVDWDNNRRLRGITIGSQPEILTGNASHPADIDIPDFTLDTVPSSYHVRLRFSGSMINATIDIQFVMTDNETRSVRAYPQNDDSLYFTLRSTGKTVGSNIFRTIQATYDAPTSTITDYHEINEEITP